MEDALTALYSTPLCCISPKLVGLLDWKGPLAAKYCRPKEVGLVSDARQEQAEGVSFLKRYSLKDSVPYMDVHIHTRNLYGVPYMAVHGHMSEPKCFCKSNVSPNQILIGVASMRAVEVDGRLWEDIWSRRRCCKCSHSRTLAEALGLPSERNTSMPASLFVRGERAPTVRAVAAGSARRGSMRRGGRAPRWRRSAPPWCGCRPPTGQCPAAPRSR